jgi:hypothetical protein
MNLTETTKENQEKPKHVSRSPDRSLYPGPPDNKAGVLTTRPVRLDLPCMTVRKVYVSKAEPIRTICVTFSTHLPAVSDR